MENYPSNSHKTREQNTDKKVEKVVSGKTSTKKKSGIRKLSDTFLSEDIGNVKNYIFAEVITSSQEIGVGYCYQWHRYDVIW